LVLAEALTPAIIDESADPVAIDADRARLDASVALPHAANIRKPLRIKPPRLNRHRRYPRLAHTSVHKNQNAALVDGLTMPIGCV
jgi:hypothetical protein